MRAFCDWYPQYAYNFKSYLENGIQTVYNDSSIIDDILWVIYLVKYSSNKHTVKITTAYLYFYKLNYFQEN